MRGVTITLLQFLPGRAGVNPDVSPVESHK